MVQWYRGDIGVFSISLWERFIDGEEVTVPSDVERNQSDQKRGYVRARIVWKGI